MLQSLRLRMPALLLIDDALLAVLHAAATMNSSVSVLDDASS